ncbi:uncharacterized protein ARMOST_02308 [Armillaria ostoyae]|uniref:Uncharacterized protein n=1 Tax=Armillaria ostoyae TaxID=47428 RepID=A0A284QRF2_ARMOS|nr:uncharacterized protein ARMOST_02308 [Armillaria ostoyae]
MKMTNNYRTYWIILASYLSHRFPRDYDGLEDQVFLKPEIFTLPNCRHRAPRRRLSPKILTPHPPARSMMASLPSTPHLSSKTTSLALSSLTQPP